MVNFILALARLISYIVGYKTLNPKKTNFFGILIFDDNSENPPNFGRYYLKKFKCIKEKTFGENSFSFHITDPQNLV